jgi:hypothetical protein
MSRLIAVVACGFMLAACSATMPNLNLDFMKSAPQAETLALACLDYRRATTDHYIRDRTFATRTLAPFFRGLGHNYGPGHHGHGRQYGRNSEYGAGSHIASINFISARGVDLSYQTGSIAL